MTLQQSSNNAPIHLRAPRGLRTWVRIVSNTLIYSDLIGKISYQFGPCDRRVDNYVGSFESSVIGRSEAWIMNRSRAR